MPEFIAGPTMVLQWIYSGGTLNLAADYRACSWNPGVDYVEASAGADTQHSRLASLKDGKASITLAGQTGGTQVIAALQPGTGGTLIIGPEGTATGKRKITFPSYSDGVQTDMPYADLVVLTCGFSGAGSALAAWTDGAY